MRDIEIRIPPGAARILRVLEDHGYEAFVVGGCVRDSLLGRNPNDWDITTSALPLQVKALFRRTIDTGLKHVEGAISMARAGSGFTDRNGIPLEEYYYAGSTIPDEYMPYIESAFNSASGQFFIVSETSENNTNSLDGKYAAFGQVIEGMEYVKAVAKVETDADDAPVTPVKIAVITFDRSVAEAALNK